MQEVDLTIYENKTNIFNKLFKIFLKSNNESIISNVINRKRNKAVKKYTVYLKNEKKLEQFESSYMFYLEAIDEYILNKVYNKVKNRVASEYERELLSKYYVIIQLKDDEYNEYKLRKQIYLLREDYLSTKFNKKCSRDYKKMYFDTINKKYIDLFKNYDNMWNEKKDEQYIKKIVSTFDEYANDALKKYSIRKDLENYFSLIKSNEILDYINKHEIQIKLLKQYLTKELSNNIYEELYNELFEHINEWLNENIESDNFEKVFENIVKDIQQYKNINSREETLKYEENLIDSEKYLPLKKQLIKLKILKKTIRYRKICSTVTYRKVNH